MYAVCPCLNGKQITAMSFDKQLHKSHRSKAKRFWNYMLSRTNALNSIEL